MTRAEAAQLYTPIYDSFMLRGYKEEAQVHQQIFKTIEDSTSQYLTDDLSTLGAWVDANEGESGGYETPVLGYPTTFTQTKFWKKFQVSFEAVDQDEYALNKKIGTVESMGRGARAKVEFDASQVLITGFSGTGPDGQHPWDTDHPKNREETGTTYSNLLTGAFSHDNLEAAETQIAANYFDMAGLPIMPTEDPLIVYPPALRGAVARVLSDRALERPDKTVRDINRFAGRYRPVEWRYLAAGLGGSDTAWFIIYPELGHLKIIWSAKPHFVSWVDEDSENYIFKGRMLYACGLDNHRCGFASTGL